MGRKPKVTQLEVTPTPTPTKKRKLSPDTDEIFPPTPLGRPWHAQVKAARANFHKGKRMSRARSIPACGLRRSARLSGIKIEDFSSSLPKATGIDEEIQKRVAEIQSVDYSKLRRDLEQRGKIQITPQIRGKPVYDLQNPDSINRRFIDIEAMRVLDGECNVEQERFERRPGAIYLSRTIFDV